VSYCSVRFNFLCAFGQARAFRTTSADASRYKSPRFVPPPADGFLNRTAAPPTKIRALSWRLPVRLRHWNTGRNSRSYSLEVHTVSVAAGTHHSSIVFLCPSGVSTVDAYTSCRGTPFSMLSRHPLPRTSREVVADNPLRIGICNQCQIGMSVSAFDIGYIRNP